MNHWMQLSIEYANQRNYLDHLFRVYPTIPDGIRDIDENRWEAVTDAFNAMDNISLVTNLLYLDLFPINGDALYEAQNLNWSEINTRSIVLFGDARPHEPDECDNGYDYFAITESLFKHGTIINSVYCSTRVDYRRLTSLHEVEIGDFSHRVSRLDHPEFFSWIANVTGGVVIGVEQIGDIVDIIKVMAAKDAGKIDELEEEEIKITTRPIPALKHINDRAKQIEEKKKILEIGYSS